ncbi:MAG TPA: ornithine carbamoyltransferase [Gaiellaceae bacterium]|jgi:ornithine carbamoyltransferase
MAIQTRTRHLLRLSDLHETELAKLLDLAARMKERPYGWLHTLEGDIVVSLFDKPSTRTRVSFAAAASRLGMENQVIRPDELQLGRGETISDTGRTLSSYAAAITVRTFAQATVDELAGSSTAPVINALTDDHHPCQALADLLTIREEFGELDGIKVAYLGDGNNVVNSLIEAAGLTGIELVVATPPGLEPSATGDVTLLHDPRAAIAGADVVYTDIWTSMGQEADREAHELALAPFEVTAELMALAARRAVFMHCLPAHRESEVEAKVIDGPQSVVWRQAANRMATEQALLYALITGDWEG